VDGHQSHLGHAGGSGAAAETEVAVGTLENELVWTADGEAELKKIPFFVRGKVRRNTETFAKSTGRHQIDSETLYDAKAHFSA
jgi:light-independent protochlorophyllide reductase subunit B